jgi:hypothetical protein
VLENGIFGCCLVYKQIKSSFLHAFFNWTLLAHSSPAVLFGLNYLGLNSMSTDLNTVGQGTSILIGFQMLSLKLRHYGFFVEVGILALRINQ